MTGFYPVRTTRGDCNFSTRRFPKTSVSTTDVSLIYVGDLVKLDAAGTVSRLLATDVSATGIAGGIVGAVARILKNEAGRAPVHAITNGAHPKISLSGDVNDWLDVYSDPDIVYECNLDVSAGSAFIGQTVGIKVTGRVTAAGISGMRADTSVSASTFNPIKIVGVSQSQLDTRLGAANGRAEVVINQHYLRTTTSY